MRRLRKEELNEEPTLSVDIHHYNAPRKPAVPDVCALQNVLPLRILAAKIISVNRAQVADYMFLHKLKTG